MFGNSPKIKDRRLLATSTIMGSMVGALALCIPLCWITNTAYLPILAIGGAALATASVWIFGKPVDPDGASKLQIAELETTIADLRERLENVEVMSRYEATLVDTPRASAKTMGVDGLTESD
jgi:hypothetical protein